MTKQLKILLTLLALTALLGSGTVYLTKVYLPSRDNPQNGEPSEPQEKQVEVIENPDGSKTYYNYVYNFKITAPVGWELRYGESNNFVNISDHAGSGLEVVAGQSSKVDSKPWIAELVSPTNMIVGGVAAEQYNLVQHREYPGGLRMALFENGGYVYEVWMAPLDGFVGSAEYNQIFDSFEFIN